MSYNYSLIIEEARKGGGLITLEKLTASSAEMARYRVKSVTIKHFSSEADARLYFQSIVAPKSARGRKNDNGNKKRSAAD